MYAQLAALKPAMNPEYHVFTRRVILDTDIPGILEILGTDSLPVRDQFGYEMAYYVAEPVYGELETVEVDYLGEPMTRQLTGDVLCGKCAAHAGDAAYYIGYQINGELYDVESLYCDDCGEKIYDGDLSDDIPSIW